LWASSTIFKYLVSSSISFRHRIKIIKVLILSIKYKSLSGLDPGLPSLVGNAKILSKSSLFSPTSFLVVIASSSISYSLSNCLSLISLMTFVAIFTCMSIFFFYSVSWGNLSNADVKLELRSVIYWFYYWDPPNFSYSAVHYVSPSWMFGPASWNPLNILLSKI